MNRFAHIAGWVAIIALALAPVARAQEGEASAPEQEEPREAPAWSPERLLEDVQTGRTKDRDLNQRREAEFKRKRTEQANLLRQAEIDRDREEARSEELENLFQDNELQIAALEQQLRTRLGSLGELFGVVRQVAGDTRSVLEGSMTSAELPGREDGLTELAESRELPTMDRLRDLWLALQTEMTETGKSTRFTAAVTQPDGSSESQEVVRIGAFTAISDGKFLRWDPVKQSLQELGRQPQSRYTNAAEGYESANGSGVSLAAIDPSKGSILALVVQAPTVGERVDQGGFIGYFIIFLGVLGTLLSIYLLITLFLTGRKMKAQLASDTPDASNPLGRVMRVYEEHREADVEALELRLDEAVLREVPKLERFITTVKVLSVIAPLLGLLGTVTGMIETFQMITLFGTGDPKMMAGGISEALVTTMLGLMMAIPLTLLHSFCRDQSKALVETLEEQSAGMLAARAEGAQAVA